MRYISEIRRPKSVCVWDSRSRFSVPVEFPTKYRRSHESCHRPAPRERDTDTNFRINNNNKNTNKYNYKFNYLVQPAVVLRV